MKPRLSFVLCPEIGTLQFRVVRALTVTSAGERVEREAGQNEQYLMTVELAQAMQRSITAMEKRSFARIQAIK